MSDTKYSPGGCICFLVGVGGGKYLQACKKGECSGKGAVLWL